MGFRRCITLNMIKQNVYTIYTISILSLKIHTKEFKLKLQNIPRKQIENIFNEITSMDLGIGINKREMNPSNWGYDTYYIRYYTLYRQR